MKKIIAIIITLLTTPVFVSAAGWVTREEGSHFFIEGGCAEKEIKIEFFAGAEDKEPVYSRDLECENGKFFFSGDLLKKKLATGNYILAVDEEKSQNVVVVKNEEYGKVEDIAPTPAAEPDPDVKFLGAIASLEQAILDMRLYLTETRYSKTIKKSVDAALDGIMGLSGKIADLLWSADNATENEDKEIVEEKESEDDPNKASEEAEAAASIEELSVPLIVEQTETISTEGLTVAPKSEVDETIGNSP